MKYADIAEALGISVSAVETLLFRARQGFRRAYEAGRGPAAASADCQWVLSRLSASIDAELGSTEQARVDAHLPACPTCQFAARELRATSRLYALVPLVAPPAGAQAAAMLTASGVGLGAASALAGGTGIAASGAAGGLVSSAVAGGAGTLAGAAAGMGSAAAAGILATVGAAKLGLAAAVAVGALVGVAWAAGAPADAASSADRRTAIDAVALPAATPAMPVVAIPPTAVSPSKQSPIQTAVPNTAGPASEPARQIAPVSRLVSASPGQPTRGGSEVRSLATQPTEPVRALVTPAPAAAPDKRSTVGADQSPQQASQTALPTRPPAQAAPPHPPQAARPTPETSGAGSTQVPEQVAERPAVPPVPRQDLAAEPSSTRGRQTQQAAERGVATPPMSTAAPPPRTVPSPLPARPPAADVRPRAGSSDAVGGAVPTRPAQHPPPVSRGSTHDLPAPSGGDAPTTNRRPSATLQPMPAPDETGAGTSPPAPPARAAGPPAQPVTVPTPATSPPARTTPAQPAPTSPSPQLAPTSPQAQPAPVPPPVQPVRASPPAVQTPTSPSAQATSSAPARPTRAPASAAAAPAQ